MRVVLIRSNPVRPYPRLEKTANALIKSGHQVHVLAWDRDQNYASRDEKLNLVDGEVTITRIGIKGEFSGGMKKNLFPLIKFQIFIYKWLIKNKNEYDLIHAYDFDTGYISMYCAKKIKKPLIYDIPDYYVESHALKETKIGEIIRKLEDSVIDYADAVIICTEKRKEQIKGTHPRKLIVLHNTPYDSLLQFEESDKREFDESKLKLAYIGVFGRTRFIDKITEIVDKRTDCEFHVGGFGGNMESYFENWSTKCSRIKYYGRVPYGKTLFIEKNCDVICAIYDPKVPNHNYAAPNKFYEALMLGKPLIMAKNTGMDEIILREDIGIVIDYTEKSLNEALTTLISKKAEWNEMGIRARNLYEKKYSWAVMEQRLLALYDEIGQERGIEND